MYDIITDVRKVLRPESTQVKLLPQAYIPPYTDTFPFAKISENFTMDQGLEITDQLN